MKRLLVLTLAIFGILAAGCIVRFGTLYETEVGGDDTGHFVGLASNLTNADIVAASIQVDFLSSSGAIILTQLVTPCTRTLQDHMDSPFQADLPDGFTARSVKTTVRPITFGTKEVADLEVDNIEITTVGDTTHITGDINVGNDDLRAVHVCAALLDDDDNVVRVGVDTTSPANIDEDESGAFDVSIETGDDIDDIEQFQLWVDAFKGNDVTAPVVVGPDDLESALQNTSALSPAVAGAGTFVTADGAFADGGAEATVTLNATGDAQSQVYTDYPLNDADIPNNADINGIAVRVDWYVAALVADNLISVDLSWDGGAHWSDALTSDDASTTQDTVILGGNSELWDHDWDEDELNDDDFQVRITAEASVAGTFNIDWIPVTVYYTDN